MAAGIDILGVYHEPERLDGLQIALVQLFIGILEAFMQVRIAQGGGGLLGQNPHQMRGVHILNAQRVRDDPAEGAALFIHQRRHEEAFLLLDALCLRGALRQLAQGGPHGGFKLVKRHIVRPAARIQRGMVRHFFKIQQRAGRLR